MSMLMNKRTILSNDSVGIDHNVINPISALIAQYVDLLMKH